MSDLSQNVAGYLIQRLYDLGVRHIFGVPGDFVLGFYHELIQSNKLKVINTCDEQGAGFAADAYARIHGLGVVCVTYCVGGLKVVNAAAQAFAEKSPLVVISGAPGIKERKKNPLLHHKVRDFDTQQKIFEHLTIDSVLIDNPRTAAKDIDRVLSSAIRYKRPVYIELPRDMTSTPIPISREQFADSSTCSKTTKREEEYETDMDSMQEAIAEAVAMINSSKRPVIIAGVEIQRFGLQDKLLQLAIRANIPVVATVLSKSVISEVHPLYLGVYEGAMGHESVREYVESSDCLILLGALMTDINFSISPTPIEQSSSIYVTSEKLTIKHHNFDNILSQDFLASLIEAPLAIKDFVLVGKQSNTNNYNNKHFSVARNQKITVKRLFERLNFSITDSSIVIADVGDSLFGSLDLTIHGQTDFLSPAYYCSMGFAVPAAIGAQLAKPLLRPIVIVGDGAFQMTGMEISTITRFALNPVIIVLNNNGYGTERPMLDGPFNDVLRWNYYRIPEIIGHGKAFLIETEGQLEDSLSAAEKFYSKDLCILDVRLDPHDGSPALQRLTESLGKKVN
ncbi:MAG TPA: thiamine pyrophosphate-binding protein [Nitrososphaeraceae archaeon]|jgi:TPP-dependent 2-oxoacid decarboxylase|nr:thiamine pyrophosphate-binding protein [Nitrososphaeraceae archaeon]